MENESFNKLEYYREFQKRLSGGPIVTRQQYESGYHEMTVHLICEGIILAINDVYTDSMPVPAYNCGNIIILNHCMSGRCEFLINESIYRYLDSGKTSLSLYFAEDRFNFPLGRYYGIQIYMIQDLLEDTSSFDKIREMIPEDPGLMIRNTEKEYSSLWTDIVNANASGDDLIIRLRVREIIYRLTKIDKNKDITSSFVTRSQAEMAKKARDILTSDLSRRIAVKSIADSFGISETSLKNYFRGVYGQCISSYMLKKRMEYAAELLKNSTHPVNEIARLAAYENQGRFARVFKDEYGVTPLEFRRISRLKKEWDQTSV